MPYRERIARLDTITLIIQCGALKKEIKIVLKVPIPEES